jgi:SWI/SNF-related matrix-associated actin-dependent regulator of chromatin subfamily A containing DEAD/H box 1
MKLLRFLHDQNKELSKFEKGKILLFSKSTKLLDLIEKTVLWTENYQYRRIDGGVETERRMQLVKEFNEDMNIFIFLISTKFALLIISL